MRELICRKCGGHKTEAVSGRLRCRPCEAAYQRSHYQTNPERGREKARRSMTKIRQDPERREALNAKRRGVEKYLEKGREYNKTLRTRHFFRWRARLVNRSGENVTAAELARLWKEQRGRCALSGRKLGRDAHVDHIHHLSNGGHSRIDNLRWLDPWVNTARSNLTDTDFIERCAQVAELIGRRLS